MPQPGEQGEQSRQRLQQATRQGDIIVVQRQLLGAGIYDPADVAPQHPQLGEAALLQVKFPRIVGPKPVKLSHQEQRRNNNNGYVPDEKCVELKSLKMYLQQFRNEGIFYENVTNSIFDDFVETLQPRHALLVASFSARGGISTDVTVEHYKGEDD